MRLTVVAVGRAKAGPARDLHEVYKARLSQRYFGRVSLTEVEEPRNLAPAALKTREAERLLAAVPAGGLIVAAGGALASPGDRPVRPLRLSL